MSNVDIRLYALFAMYPEAFRDLRNWAYEWARTSVHNKGSRFYEWAGVVREMWKHHKELCEDPNELIHCAHELTEAWEEQDLAGPWP